VRGRFNQHGGGWERYTILAAFARILYRWNGRFQSIPFHYHTTSPWRGPP
jgi:hypothetical protein